MSIHLHHRSACIAALAILCAPGCGQLSSDPQGATANAPDLAPIADPQVLIWSAANEKAAPAHDNACTGRDPIDRVDIKELRADSNWLYVDVSQRSSMSPEKRDGMSAEIHVLKDNCPVSGPRRVSGTIWRNADRPSTLVTSLSDLPDGDLQIAVKVEQAQTVFHVRKSGKSIRWTGSNERVHPADPATGLPAYVAVFGEGECPKQAAL